ncbi:MAG TPA: hypothetical protein VIJ87_21680 [Pyrinomonadaceae bacterium]
MNENKYRRVQRKEDGEWFTLELRDIFIQTDNQARELVAHFTSTQGGEYRTQFKHGRRWYTVPLNLS